MKKGGMTAITGGNSQFGNLKAKPIKSSTSNRGFTRQKGIGKRSMSFSYKK
jgi:hypothetical protein